MLKTVELLHVFVETHNLSGYLYEYEIQKKSIYFKWIFFISFRFINLMGPGVTLYSKPLYTMNELINKCKHI